MTISMASDMLLLFIDCRAENTKTKDTSTSIYHAKWNMKELLDFYGESDLKKLIKFYCKLSERPTMQDFFLRANEYYDSMIDVIEHMKYRKALVKETLKE